MSTTGQQLRELRERTGLTLRKAAMLADIDVAILSKMERGERKLTKEIILKLAEMYHENPDKLIINFLSEKVVYELKDEEHGLKALKAAERQLRYKKIKNDE